MKLGDLRPIDTETLLLVLKDFIQIWLVRIEIIGIISL